ncbi:hypothetical protein PQR05_22295 [Paraburkholderia sediminicola]|uniref:Lipoprotein n=1 Tax=Paraburkholderia metrosideri TaxID=580937 RepID=A0ABW9DXJ7_9BURK
MKRRFQVVLVGATFLTGCATAKYDSMGPALSLMSQQQKCYLVAQTASAAAKWRDDGVPVSEAHARLDAVIMPMRAPDDYKQRLHEGIDTTYQSHVTEQQLYSSMKGACRAESAKVPAAN